MTVENLISTFTSPSTNQNQTTVTPPTNQNQTSTVTATNSSTPNIENTNKQSQSSSSKSSSNSVCSIILRRLPISNRFDEKSDTDLTKQFLITTKLLEENQLIHIETIQRKSDKNFIYQWDRDGKVTKEKRKSTNPYEGNFYHPAYSNVVLIRFKSEWGWLAKRIHKKRFSMLIMFFELISKNGISRLSANFFATSKETFFSATKSHLVPTKTIGISSKQYRSISAI